MRLTRRVVGGREAREGEFPFVANIQYTHDQRPLQCVGTIIHSQVIVLPAFCVVHPQTHRPVDHRDLVVGYGSVERSRQRHARVVKIVAHKEFVADEMTNDIALLQVEPLDLTAPGADKIPVYTGGVHAHQQLDVMGWGMDGEAVGEWSEKLRTTSVTIGETDRCRKSGNYNGVEGRVLCTDNQLNPGHDLCDGEFGASLVAKVDGQSQLVGMYSYHVDTSAEGYSRCAKNTSMAFYTHIYGYIGFIAATTGVPVDEFTARAAPGLGRPSSNMAPIYLWGLLLAIGLVWAAVYAVYIVRERRAAAPRHWQGAEYELVSRLPEPTTDYNRPASPHSPDAEVVDIVL
ncbi:Trypsin-2 [Coemansia sp. RSA 552]|nr:Trypsin-2 [Coemansia sp. RSA 552]